MTETQPPFESRDTVHTVEPNEDMGIIAKRYGIANWGPVWEHEKNKDLRELRKDPSVLYKGDEVYIPEVEGKQFEVALNTRHTFTLYEPKFLLHLELAAEGEALDEERYEVWIDGHEWWPPDADEHTILTTGPGGLIHHLVPVGSEIEVRLWHGEHHEDEQEGEIDEDAYQSMVIHPGYLDPIETIDGVQDRLINLGYTCGDDPQGEMGEASIDALRHFQVDYGLVPSGEIDDFTRQTLLEANGS